ncbi:hypothetical protein M8C21_015080 [Ambrosia artemisiifolia]|uniref:TF-B3 domain-containing protein n=1 Tax=Ambrosia artemisiifolia TaxID=4212 RepID=A0AAD5BRI1_AMBAR|nr:hypothetical protein M8C21_015080 [Ambrosia artemisiifolia]
MQTQNNTTFYSHHSQPPSSASGFNLNNNQHQHQQQQQQQQQQFVKQNMFEKPLTPSDVGKLNRLVIPKQYAEKYFPRGRGTDLQNGLVLSFEDEGGKLWGFRYSYWNSSQSYVLTKGWNRYVKEKQLVAGDVVLFQRHVLDCDRMFIGWRRRFVDQPGGGDVQPITLSLPYQPDCLHAVEMYKNVDTYQRGEVATRRLRLFGVNLEYQDTSEPSDPYGSSQDGQSDHQYNFSSNNLHHNMVCP